MKAGERRRRGAAAVVAAVLIVLPAGQAQAKKVLKTVTKTFCTDLSLPVPDGSASGDFVSGLVSTGKRCPKKLVCGYGGLPMGARVLDVDAKIRVTHPATGDLTVLLVDPTGGLNTLTAGNGGLGANYGAGSTNCAGAFTTLDDSAGTSIQAAGPAQAPFAGSFRPQQPLSLHNGSFGSGDWRFYFDDVAAGNRGTVDAVAIRLRYRYIVRKKR